MAGVRRARSAGHGRRVVGVGVDVGLHVVADAVAVGVHRIDGVLVLPACAGAAQHARRCEHRHEPARPTLPFHVTSGVLRWRRDGPEPDTLQVRRGACGVVGGGSEVAAGPNGVLRDGAAWRVTPAMSAVTRRRPATYADLEALAPNLVGELVAGEPYASPRPAFPHPSGAATTLAQTPEVFGVPDRVEGTWWAWAASGGLTRAGHPRRRAATEGRGVRPQPTGPRGAAPLRGRPPRAAAPPGAGPRGPEPPRASPRASVGRYAG